MATPAAFAPAADAAATADAAAPRWSLTRWWVRLHWTHHDHYRCPHEPIWPSLTVHHHLLDASLQVGVNIVVQQVPFLFGLVDAPGAIAATASAVFGASSAGAAWGRLLWPGGPSRHPASKLAHNVVVTWLLIEAHSGFDLPFMSHRLLPGLLGGAVRHQWHHDTGKGAFQQFFRYLDDADPAQPAPWGTDRRRDT